MQIFEGRPKNNEERLSKEIKCYDFLDDLGIDYLRVDHSHQRVKLHMVLKGKFRIILQKILQIYVSIILEFSLSYIKISSF